MKRELLAAAIAFVIAIGVIFLVKKYLVHLEGASSDKEVILLLEFGAVLLVFASFVISEFLRMFRELFKLVRGKKAQTSMPSGVVTLFVTVIVSLSIYFSFVKLMAHP
jgi:hypothetical protein